MIQIASKLPTPLDYAALPREELAERIAARKAELNAVILGHNYQRIDIQEVSDYLGDSLGLSQEAARTDADVIVFCGVHFMAETAKVLSPDKMVLMPDLRAGCPMADFVTGDALRRLKARYPDAAVVAYVNSTAEVKAELRAAPPQGSRCQLHPADGPSASSPTATLACTRLEERPPVCAGRGGGEVQPAPSWPGALLRTTTWLDELAAAKKKHPAPWW